MSRSVLWFALGMVCLGLIFVAGSGISPSAAALATEASLPGWRQANADGFGDANNQQVPSLAVFEDHLYAGTWNNDAGTISLEIWRTADGLTWEPVADASLNGAAALIVYKDYIYAGTWNGVVLRSEDGLAWTQVGSDGFGDPNNGIARFAVFDGTLYASTWSVTGTEIWRTTDGLDWEQHGTDGLGDPNNGGAIASEVFNGELYFGISNWVDGGEIWSTDGSNWTPWVTDGFGNANNYVVSSLAAFNGELYAGTGNDNGLQVWRFTDSNHWDNVVAAGFENPDSIVASALEVFDGHLYLVAKNDVWGLQVWRTADGSTWEQVAFEGFGDSGNIETYWENSITVFQDSLYIGTNNFNTGGEVWQMLPYRISLPYVTKDYMPGSVTVWHYLGGDYTEEYQAIVAEYNLAHPDAQVQFVYVADMFASLPAAIASGTGPDVVLYPNDRIGEWAAGGALAPLDPWVSAAFLDDNFEPAAARTMIWNGQIWGIPEMQEGVALVYNKALISEAELPAPDDFADLLSKAAAFQSAHPGRFYLCNQGLGNMDAYHVGPIYFGHGMSVYGGYVDEDGIAYMDTSEALNAAYWIDDFSPYAPVTTSHEICQNMLINGEAAIWWTGPWAIADLKNAGLDYGIAPMGSPFVGVKLFSMTANAVERGKAEAALDVMLYFGSAEVQSRLAVVNGTVPANTAALNDPAVQALYEVAQFGSALHFGTPMGNHIYSACQWETVAIVTLAIWQETLTPEAALAIAQEEIEFCVASISPP